MLLFILIFASTGLWQGHSIIANANRNRGKVIYITSNLALTCFLLYYKIVFTFRSFDYDLIIIYNIDVPYEIISSGDCASNGMRMITNRQDCERAAKNLHLLDITSSEYQFADRSHGCLIQFVNRGGDYLVWAPPEYHPHANIPCGSKDFSCICAKNGTIDLALIKY